MSELLDIIISAVDEASSIFESITGSATDMADNISSSLEGTGGEFDAIADNVSNFSDAVENVDDSTLEELASTLDMDVEEVERLLEVGADVGSISFGFEEVADAADNLEMEVTEAADAMEELGSAGDVMAVQTLMDVSEGAANAMMSAADAAGNFGDSMTRMGLAAEGAGIPVDQMKTAVSNLAEETGRAGGIIRESFISMSSAGITELSSMETLFKGVSAQAFILGTDVESLSNKMSGMAMKSSIAERTLKGTGITVEELGSVLGIQGATIDDVNAKWETMDVNARAAALGQAMAMNEGKDANDAYKNSWQGLQDQIEIAKGKLERVAGDVLLPVLVPAMKLAGDILQGVGDTISWVMSGPFGGLVSVLGAAAGLFLILVTGVSALSTIIGFLGLETTFTTIETIALALAEEGLSLASISAAVSSMGLSGGLLATATAAWGAAAAVWALIAPLLPFIVAAVAVAVAIYEIGKAFGWWTDVGSMIDAITSGVQRLWDAFINHPDVQAVIKALSDAWNWLVGAVGNVINAIKEFFNINTGGDFDIVRAIIDGIGAAWEAIKFPIEAVITVIQWAIEGFGAMYDTISEVWNAIMGVVGPIISQIIGFVMSLISTIDAFRNGQMDLPTFILTILGQLWNAYLTVTTSIGNLMLQFASKMLTYALNAGRNVLNGIVQFLSQLPGRMASFLSSALSQIISYGSQWVSSARSKASEIVNGVASTLSALPGRIASAISGVVDAIVSPFREAYNRVKSIVDDIVSLGGNIAFGGDLAYGGDSALDVATGNLFNTLTGEVTGDSKITVDVNENIKLDLVNVPAHIDEDTLITMLQDRNVLKALTGNKDFQELDNMIKEELLAKTRRANGG